MAGSSLLGRGGALGVLSMASMLILLAGGPAGGTHGVATATGGGPVVGTLTQTDLFGPSVLPPGLPCAEYSQLSYQSQTGYSVTYEVGGQRYSGPVTTSYVAIGTTYQNPLGSFSTSAKCRDLTVPGDGPGFVVSSVTGTLDSDPPGALDCDYTSGTWQRIGSIVNVTLSGSCTISGASGATHEQRLGEFAPVGPAPTTTVGTETLSAVPGRTPACTDLRDCS